ncbi:hypothetical protein EV281_105206 [Rhizobium sp. BK418]|nr:hypothetical protein EV281_105206 [Rhizobium sp. BK418]
MGFDDGSGDDLSELIDEQTGSFAIQILCSFCQIQAFLQDNSMGTRQPQLSISRFII